VSYIDRSMQSPRQHFLYFHKLWKFSFFFKGLLKRCMPVSVNATCCLCRRQPLSHPLVACLPVCTNRPLHESGLCNSVTASRVVFRTWASQRRQVRAVSYRDRSMQSPIQAETAFVRDRVHQKQSERDRFCKAWGGGILKMFKKSKNARNWPKRAQN
jgi:hypothetical protein